MGNLIRIDFQKSNQPYRDLESYRKASGLNPAQFVDALSKEVGYSIPVSMYLAWEKQVAPVPTRIGHAVREIAFKASAEKSGHLPGSPLANENSFLGLGASENLGAIDLELLSTIIRTPHLLTSCVDRLVENLEQIHFGLNIRSEVDPPRLVSPDLEVWLNLLLQLLEQNPPEPAALRIRSMAARAANHLGYLSFRDLRRVNAYRHYALSEGLARDAKDDGELAILFLRKQQLVAAMEGFPAAVSLVKSINTLLTPNSPSGITAWRWGELARQESILGNEISARRYLELAFSAAERDPRLNLFAPDKDSRWLARRPAYVALRLGHADEAIQILESNRKDSDSRLVRETVWNSIELGEAWTMRGELDNALQYLRDALDLALATEDRRGLAFIQKVRKKMETRWGNDARLKELNEGVTHEIP